MCGRRFDGVPRGGPAGPMARPSPFLSRSMTASARPYVLARLGFPVSRENPQLAARYFFDSAQLYEMIGMIEERDAALIEADKLYK